jgi:selenide,water dikinase
MQSEIKLLQYSKASGCGCKLPPEILKNVIGHEKNAGFTKLVSGNENNEDAAAIDIGNGNLILQTLDFFTPIVNDAFDFGQIAAANAISDVYAMGGEPISAIAIVGWPVNNIPIALLQKVMEGARKKCTEAGIPLCGGHSIESTEPIFGLSVNGINQKENLKRNNTVKEGDLLFLTKPLGSGIFSAALKRDLLKEEHYKTWMNYCTQLNSIGKHLGKQNYVNAITDITGFGLLGHLREMLSSGEYSAELEFDKIPLMSGVTEYAKQFIHPNLTTTNFNAVSSVCEGLNGLEFLYLCDPQTNGGLLCSVNSYFEKEFRENCTHHSVQPTCIGKIIPKKEKQMYIIV